jgi:hypothetical protein
MQFRVYSDYDKNANFLSTKPMPTKKSGIDKAEILRFDKKENSKSNRSTNVIKRFY